MQQLSIHRYFKHKYHNSTIKSVMLKNDSTNMYNLYIELVDGDEIVGMSGSEQFMLATALREEEWTTLLEEWCRNNLYVDYQPFLMSQEEGVKFIQECLDETKKHPNYRLGQAIINKLDKKTAIPNNKIFNSLDNQYVVEWFYKNYTQ